MKLLITLAISIGFLGACGPEQALELEDANVSAMKLAVSPEVTGVPVCNKMMPPQCFVGGKKIKTNLGTPITDSDGNYIFE